MESKDNPFILISSFAEAYHWTIPEIFKLTMPQIIMMNHAAYYNSEFMKARVEANSDRPSNERTNSSPYTPPSSSTGWFDSNAAKQIVKDDPCIMGNKTLSEVSSDFDILAKYLSDWSV